MRALVQATRRILGKRGRLSDGDESELADIGLERPVLYEIIAIIGIKTTSNYINHIARTEVDGPFQQQWEPEFSTMGKDQAPTPRGMRCDCSSQDV